MSIYPADRAAAPNTALTCTDVSQAWIEKARKIMEDGGYEQARKGEGLTIELRSLHDNTWRPLTLETSRTVFASEKDRDWVLSKLNTPLSFWENMRRSHGGQCHCEVCRAGPDYKAPAVLPRKPEQNSGAKKDTPGQDPA